MTTKRRLGELSVLAMAALAALASACGSDGDGDTDTGADTDTDTDTDTDIDTDTDADTDTDIDTDTDADTDTDTDTDTDSDTGTEVQELPTEADETRLTETVQALSSEEMGGRLTGTASGDLAEAFVTDFLTTAGYEVQTQDVQFPLFEVGSPAVLRIVDEGGATVDEFDYFEEFREVDFSGSGAATGELTFAGYGIVKGDYDSFGTLDLTGKVVAMLTGVPAGEGMNEDDDGRLDQKIQQAVSRGAAGIVFVLAGTYASGDSVENELYASDKYGDLHPDLLSATTPVAFLHLGATERLLGKTAPQLASDPTSFETTTRVQVEIHGTTQEAAVCQNIFGVIPGTDPALSSEVVIVGAHYDHLGIDADENVFYGAGDNASGTSIVLEAAATMQAHPVDPKRTVVFAFFCAEEQGLRGSIEYAIYGTPLYPLADTKLMIAVDYIAGADGPYLTNVDDNADVLAFLGGETEADVLPVKKMNLNGDCASDDCAFLWSTPAVPAYRFYAPSDVHHVPEDTFENLDLEMLDRVADVVIRGVGHVAY